MHTNSPNQHACSSSHYTIIIIIIIKTTRPQCKIDIYIIDI